MKISDDLVNIVDFITSAPGTVARKADQFNDKTISFLQDIENALAASGEVAEQNLRQNKIRSLGRSAADWLSRPFNLGLTAAGIVGVFLIVIILSRK